MKKAGAWAPALENRGETARLEYGVAVLAGADADDVFEGTDEDFPVADLAGAGGRGDRLKGPVHTLIGDAELDFDLGEKIDDILAAAVDIGVPLLAAEALHFGDGHAFDADFGEGIFHFLQFEGFDDGGNELHERMAGPAAFSRCSLLLRAR